MASASDWTRLRDLFDRAVALGADERAQLLGLECAQEPDLRRRVEELLASHDAAGGFLSASTAPMDPVSDRERRGTWELGPGSVIGQYKILQQIGEGGFGAVFMAEQQHPIVRRVALKVIKLGMDTKQVIARFEAERQALALMDHINIARILDAGTTDEGRPFFVMELVRGIPITEYCDREHVPVSERLQLFISVCRAVEHAHQKGVIHRDLKPSNVLVTLHDGLPVPKVIDFGVARAIHQKLTERTLFTEYGQFIGTPEYMSPEQCEMSGLDIDTRTDIYSLGALLYELLTGQNLFEPRRLRALALKEIQRVLQEEEPPEPSSRLASLGASANEISGRRDMPLPQLLRCLRGDPDKIVMKAISKDRRRRYDSAGALAEDVGRFLRCEPVSARAPEFSYRAGRFLRRHRVSAGVAAVLLTALIVGGGLAFLGLVRARRAESIAKYEAERSALEADALRAIVRDDEEAYVATTRAAVALRRAARGSPPSVLAFYLADVVCLLGAMKWDTPLPPATDSLLRELELEAIDRVLQLEDVRDPRELQIVDALAQYAAQFRRDRLLPLLRRSLALRSDLEASDPELLEARRRLASELLAEGERELAAGRTRGARALLEDAVLRARESWDLPDPPQLARARGVLGACLVELGEFPAAESLLAAAWNRLNSRESLEWLIGLYRAWGRPDPAQHYADLRMVESIRELDFRPEWSDVVDQELCGSGEFRGRAVWLFGQTRMRSGTGTTFRVPNTWAWSSDRDARDGIALQHSADRSGMPLQLLPYTPAEQARLAPDTAASIQLRPGLLISDPARGRALIAYGRSFRTPGAKPIRRDSGSSMAVWLDPDAPATRPELRPDAGEPTLLFSPGEPEFSAGGVVHDDTLYLYAARPRPLTCSVIVARAPLARALEREAWRFYAGDRRWTAQWREATEIMQSGPVVSVHWNPHLQRYFGVTSWVFGGEIELRTAPRPEGPWSRPHAIGTGLRPGEIVRWSGEAIAHAHLMRDKGRREYLTFRRSTGALSSEIRMLEIILR